MSNLTQVTTSIGRDIANKNNHYEPDEIEWEVAKQMNHDFNRLKNQSETIKQLFIENSKLRDEIKNLYEVLDKLPE